MVVGGGGGGNVKSTQDSSAMLWIEKFKLRVVGLNTEYVEIYIISGIKKTVETHFL